MSPDGRTVPLSDLERSVAASSAKRGGWRTAEAVCTSRAFNATALSLPSCGWMCAVDATGRDGIRWHLEYMTVNVSARGCWKPERVTVRARPVPPAAAARTKQAVPGRPDPGDVRDYPLYLVNGRPAEDPAAVPVSRGDGVRLRLINPSAGTLFCVFVEGHELEVVRPDGLAVRPVRTDAAVLGMGERYDVLLEARGAGVSRLSGGFWT